MTAWRQLHGNSLMTVLMPPKDLSNALEKYHLWYGQLNIISFLFFCGGEGKNLHTYSSLGSWILFVWEKYTYLCTLAIAWTVEYHLFGGMDRRATLPSGRQTLNTLCNCDWWSFYSKVREDMFSMPRVKHPGHSQRCRYSEHAGSEIISILLFLCY